MSDNLRDIAAVPSTITIAGVEYKLAPLTLKDMAEAEAFVVDRRCDAQLAQAGRPPGMNAEVLANVLAKIRCGACDFFQDVLFTVAGTAKVIELSMRRASPRKAVPTWDAIASASGSEIPTLRERVLEISGFMVPKGSGDGPLDSGPTPTVG